MTNAEVMATAMEGALDERLSDERLEDAHEAIKVVGEYIIELLAAVEMLENYCYMGGGAADGGDSAVQVVTALGARIRAEAFDKHIIVENHETAGPGQLLPGPWHVTAQDALYLRLREKGVAR
ncbi:MAG: hypothetical protein ACRDHY_03095 [Anaerolineales bacterium]